MKAYLPQDRWRALATGCELPQRPVGSALLADISGFTALTAGLALELGPRRGIEELAARINAVYETLIGAVEHEGGSVIGFAGDAVTCWFDGADGVAGVAGGSAVTRAAACARAMHAGMQSFVDLSLKIAVTAGPAFRFVVGDPAIQRLDALAGATIARLATGERLCGPGETLIDAAGAAALGLDADPTTWRGAVSTDRFALLLPESAGLGPAAFWPEVPTLDAGCLQPWLLPAVYQREHHGHGAFLTELRPAAALFLRFSGIDCDADPEAGGRLDALIRSAQAVIAAHEGALLQLTIGDKGSYFYASFGALVAHEDNARRAAAAALELRSLPERLRWLPPVQIGLGHGTMRVGAYGSRSRRTYGALGEDTNLAAGLMAAAAPGEIWIAAPLQIPLAPWFEFEPRSAAQADGKTGSQTLFAVTGARQRPARAAAAKLPMIGRDAEVEAAEALFEQVRRGAGRTLLIEGEAGLGKSRLVDALMHRAQRQGFVVHHGACQASGTRSADSVWKPIWQSIFTADAGIGAAPRIAAAQTLLQRIAPTRLIALPLLAPLLDLPLADNNFTRALAPKDRRNLLTSLLGECLTALATPAAPLLLVVEDLHWIDALGHDLLLALARRIDKVPACLVITRRPPEAGALAPPPGQLALVLRPLAAGDADALLAGKMQQWFEAPNCTLPPSAAQALVTRAQGNPFYLEELLNDLHERHPDWRAFAQAAACSAELPQSLQALILSRIDRISETQRVTLKTASVIGRLFRFDWLHGYYPQLGAADRLRSDLGELQRLDLTLRAAGETTLAYVFKHIVTRDVAYDSLPFATRAALHEQFAAFIESLDAPPPPDLLAFHYDLSHNLQKRREWLRRAADAAQAAFANAAALDYLARLMPLAQNEAEQIELRLQRAEVLVITGAWSQAEQVLREALAQAQDTANSAATARSQHALGTLLRMRGDAADALPLLAQASAGFEALAMTQDHSEALSELGGAHFETGDYASANALLDAALALARATSNHKGCALALVRLGVVAAVRGEPQRRDACYQECAALREALGDRRGLAAVRVNMGIAAYDRGELGLARQLYEESLALDRMIGDRDGAAGTLYNIGLVANEQGDIATARALFDESLASLREIGNKASAVYPLMALAGLLLEGGELDTAAQFYAESLSIREQIGDKKGCSETLDGIASCALAQRDLAAAHAAAQRGLRLRQELGDAHIGFDLIGCAAISAAAADWAAAVRLSAVAERERDAGGLVWVRALAQQHASTLAAARAAVGATTFERLWTAADLLSLADAVALVLARSSPFLPQEPP